MTGGEFSLSSVDEWEEQLQSLLLAAHENDLDVEGGWECRNGDGHPDWDVVVTEVVKADVDD